MPRDVKGNTGVSGVLRGRSMVDIGGTTGRSFQETEKDDPIGVQQRSAWLLVDTQCERVLQLSFRLLPTAAARR